MENWGYPHDFGNPETSMTGIDDHRPCTSLWRIFSPRLESYLIERTVLSFGDPKNYANGMCVEQMGKQSFCSCNGWAGICMCVVELPAWVYQPLQAKKTSTSVCTFPFLLAYHIVSVLFKTCRFWPPWFGSHPKLFSFSETRVQEKMVKKHVHFTLW